ncbi:TadE/TadG family type IV pilus assembly protein [Caballeronia sp. Lep1P3]|uniref:TadE/TadG family type IV pilus assembly protein n=1 Tax=Caballeronia sp. Lep1P3 TaxID=2878150 RepID=UPI001FD36383|nr:TadE/TadG family type IV pilus assembly protein [Caballeronia sp. Lep1P3]
MKPGERSARAAWRTLLRSDRGSAAVEFVVIVPLMLLVLLGFTEMYLYMRAVSLVEHTAFTLADSIGQMTQVMDDSSTTGSNNLGAIWNAATLIAAPETLSKQGGVVVTSVCEQASSCNGLVTSVSKTPGVAKILWQKQAPWNASGMSTHITPTSILPTGWPFRNGDSAVIVEVFYSYTPFSMTAPFWQSAPGTQTIYERVVVRPRTGQSLTLQPQS